MADGLPIGEQEKDEFELGFEAGESGEKLPEEPSSDGIQEESDDFEPETDGGAGDPLSGDEDADAGSESASDQNLPEEDESGEEPDSTDTDDADLRGSEDADPLAEGRDLLEQYFGDQGNQEQPNHASGAEPELVEAPSEIKAEAEAIIESNPQFKEILLEDSEQGKRFRSSLFQFGPEAVMGMLESAHQVRQVNARVEEVTSRHEQDQRKAHFAAIGNKHPDYVNMVNDPGKAEDLQQFNSALKGWAEGLPYREATEAFRVMGSGSAAEVSALLTKYKEATSGTGKDKVDRKAARKIIAVPGKRKAVKRSMESHPDDFDSAFEKGY